MAEAFRLAERAAEAGEVPVGAVILHEGRVIARAHNQVETLRDATAHAEMIAITQAAEALDNWRRKQSDLPSRPEAVRRLLADALKRKT